MNVKMLTKIFMICSILLSSDNIYQLNSSTRNTSLGGTHISSNNLSSIFDSPLRFDSGNSNNLMNKSNFYFAYHNQYHNQVDVLHFGYCAYSSKEMNLGIGLVSRKIENNFNTNNSWIDNGDGIPNQDEIDYNQIYKFNDQEIGFLISYNRKLTNSILAVNLKPTYHSIDNISSSGISFDIFYMKDIKLGKCTFGLQNIGSFKKWENGTTETFEPSIFINSEFELNKFLLCMEFNSDYNLIGGIEYNLNDLIDIRLGSNSTYISMGFGLKTNFANIDYAYIKNYNSILDESHKISFLIDMSKNVD